MDNENIDNHEDESENESEHDVAPLIELVNEEFSDDETFMSLTGSENSSDEVTFDHAPSHPFNGNTDEADLTFTNSVNIDKDLIGMHSYLNKDMESLVGRIILEPDTVVELYLFWRPHVILVPGQKLPLQVRSGQDSIFIRAKETNRTIGFIASPIDQTSLNDCIGTTAEMINIRSDQTGLTAMVIGRQRLRTIAVHRNSDNNLIGTVRILGEYSELAQAARYPLQHTLPHSWRLWGPSSRLYKLPSMPAKLPSPQPPIHASDHHHRNTNNSGSFLSKVFRRRPRDATPEFPLPEDHAQQQEVPEAETEPDRQEPLLLLPGNALALQSSTGSTWVTARTLREQDTIITPAVDSKGRAFTFSRSESRNWQQTRIPARRDVHAAAAHAMGRFPAWVYELYDTERLIGLIVRELKDWNSTWKLDQWTEEIAVQFSYWLLQNLPVPDLHKIRILQMDHVVSRLRGCLDLLVKCSTFLCALCQLPITSKRQIVCLAAEGGSQQTFVNPDGHLHEMLTVSGLADSGRCVQFVGPPTERFSWFPGYKWTIMQCRMCRNHLGWKFSAGSSSGLRPSVFYGVCRSSVVPNFYGEQDRMTDFHSRIYNPGQDRPDFDDSDNNPNTDQIIFV